MSSFGQVHLAAAAVSIAIQRWTLLGVALTTLGADDCKVARGVGHERCTAPCCWLLRKAGHLPQVRNTTAVATCSASVLRVVCKQHCCCGQSGNYCASGLLALVRHHSVHDHCAQTHQPHRTLPRVVLHASHGPLPVFPCRLCQKAHQIH